MMNMRICKVMAALGAAAVLAACERPPVTSEQQGFRGTGMVEVSNPRLEAARAAVDEVPEPLPSADTSGPKAGDVYQNVEVLGDLSVGEFTRVMTAITNWVSPEEGCAYCHEGANLASEAKYQKRVSRRMLEMTQHINAQWTDHVGDTGVTCYTCHRGQNVPQHIWFEDPGPKQAAYAGNRAGQNQPAESVAYASLPADPFSELLVGDANIRVSSRNALPPGEGAWIMETETTYGLMMHMSDALGQNCTFCHNSRAFYTWEESSPKRVTAWHGIQMVRGLNQEYLIPLQGEYPEQRLGPLGDAPKANCATCHQGAHKPLGGAQMVADYESLRGQ